MAARFANEFNVPFAPVDTAGEQFRRVKAACEAAGRDPHELEYSHAITVCCGEREAELQRRASRIGRDLEDLRRSGAAGTPEEVITRLAEYGRAGASRSYLQVIDMDDLDHIALIAAEVAPHL
jgi:alkanesulfonate monooxygenase SsuD/methylene tetrahydromethanopterin reductase-like flavin-dependent oxidoreductase (luciferase family)